MNVSFEDWLQAQLGRDDLVGKIARSWLEHGFRESSGQIPFQDWWDSVGLTEFGQSDHQLALHEYESALKDLKAGISPESFSPALANERILEALDKSGDWHSKNPDLTAAEYLWTRHIELWRFIKSKTTLYLDTGYWVNPTQL